MYESKNAALSSQLTRPALQPQPQLYLFLFLLLPLHLQHRKQTIFLALLFSRVLLATFAVPLE